MKFPTSPPLGGAKSAATGSLAAALLLGSGAVWAQAPAAALEGCRALAADSARLACYDALLPPRLSAAPPTAAAPSAKPAIGAAQPTATPSPPAAVPLAVVGTSMAVPPATVANTTAPAGPATVALERQFGLEDRTPEVRAQRLQSRIAGRFEGWGPKEKLTLANGQVWQIQDDSVAAYSLNSPVVEIERGAFGSFFMRIEGVAQVPKVRRLQ